MSKVELMFTFDLPGTKEKKISRALDARTCQNRCADNS